MRFSAPQRLLPHGVIQVVRQPVRCDTASAVLTSITTKKSTQLTQVCAAVAHDAPVPGQQHFAPSIEVAAALDIGVWRRSFHQLQQQAGACICLRARHTHSRGRPQAKVLVHASLHGHKALTDAARTIGWLGRKVGAQHHQLQTSAPICLWHGTPT